jgi:hypothetical protein
VGPGADPRTEESGSFKRGEPCLKFADGSQVGKRHSSARVASSEPTLISSKHSDIST